MAFDERCRPSWQRGFAGVVAWFGGVASVALGGPVSYGGDADAAEPPRVGVSTRAGDFLSWQAPAGCSTAAAVRDRVSELLGKPELDLKQVQRVEGRVSKAADGWLLRLTFVDALGTRERQLSSGQCGDLAEAAAVAITLAFEAARPRDSALLREPAQAAPAGEASAFAESSLEDSAPSAGSAAVEAPAPDKVTPSLTAPKDEEQRSLGAELLVDVNSLPSVAPGVSLLGGLRWPELELGAYATWLPPKDESVGPGQRVAFSLLSGGLRACYALGHGLVDTAVCAGLEAGRLSARGAGLVRAQSVNDLWLAPHAGLSLRAALAANAAFHVRGEAVVPLLRQGYAINEIEDIHHVESLGLRVALGGALTF